MSWINMLTPMQWLLLAAIPPAILSLYFLKLKRRESLVPSTLLWKKAIEDLHVNSIWQRLRKNLLLYLQLLFMALLTLACLRPGWSGLNRIGERRIYVIDNSASMQATDVQPSRLEVAKSKARALISDASSNDVAMVIAFSDRADVRQGFTSDRRRLLDAVDSIQPTSRTTDANEALRAASGLANPGRTSFEENKDIQVAEAVPATVYMLTDGAIGKLGEDDLGQLKIEYIPIGKPGTENLGIVGFAIERDESQKENIETFARIINRGSEHVDCTASLYLDNNLVDASSVSIDAGQEVGLRFELSGVDSGQLRLELDHQDPFMVDNVAYAAIRPNRQVSVLLVTAGNTALEKALQTTKLQQLASLKVESIGFLDSPEYAAASADAQYDLIIYDACTPKVMPSGNTLFLGGVPPEDIQGDSRWEFGELTGPALILDVNRTNPVTEYLEMASVSIVEMRTVKPPATGTVLMTSDVGPVFAVAPRGPYQDAILGFELVRPTAQGIEINSDWGIKRSFPVFVYAAIEHLGGGITAASAPSVVPGGAIHLTLSSRSNRYDIIDPKGKKTSIDRGVDGRFIYTQTDAPGVYEVYSEGLEQAVERFCSNLFSASESDLAIRDTIDTGAEKVVATGATIRARQETWRWLLVIGLGLLMLEWIIFNKRIFV